MTVTSINNAVAYVFAVRVHDDGLVRTSHVAAPAAEAGLRLMADIAHSTAEGLDGDGIGVPSIAEVVYVPDEPDLAALTVSVDLISGRSEWAVIDTADRHGIVQSIEEGAPFPDRWRAVIEEPDELDVTAHWGRPLSVAAFIRLALTDPDPAALWPVTSGQAVVALRREEHGPSLESSEQLEHALAGVASIDDLGYAPLAVSAVQGDLRGGWRSWIGPHADRVERGQLTVIHLFDLQMAAAALTAALALNRCGPFTGDVPDRRAFGDDATDGRMWASTTNGQPFWVDLSEVTAEAATRALTLHEAAAWLVHRRATTAEVAAGLGERFTQRTGQDACVLAHDMLRLGPGDSMNMLCNVASLLERFSPSDVLERMVAMWENRSKEMSGAFPPDGHWLMRHVRPSAWVDAANSVGEPLAFTEALTDDAGQSFQLVGALENDDNLMFLTEAALSAFNTDRAAVASMFTAHRPQVRFEAAFHRHSSAIVEFHGPNIASALADEGLTAGLVAALRAHGLQFGNQLFAHALTTDFVLLALGVDELAERMAAALDDARARGWVTQGQPLDFIRFVKDSDEPPAGMFTLIRHR